MAKPLNEFGGWLRFFQITNIIGTVFLIIVIALSILSTVSLLITAEYKEVVGMIVMTIDITITVGFTIMILWNIKKKDESTPAKIRYYLLLILIFSLVFLVIEIPVTNWICDRKLSFINFQYFQDAARSVIFCLIWMSYFKKSKRVSLYYNNRSLKAT